MLSLPALVYFKHLKYSDIASFSSFIYMSSHLLLLITNYLNM